MPHFTLEIAGYTTTARSRDNSNDVVAMVTVQRFINGQEFGIQNAITVDDVLHSGASMRELVEKAARDGNKVLDLATFVANAKPAEAFRRG
ncbi:MAG TPA: hypothetical protein VN181_03500 [Thermoanaerobaculia bacterium]|nr:hypothetical protein [Thermoanaerobaculia bacterium]